MSNNKSFIPIAEPLLDGKELEYITDCVKSGWISSLGKYVRDFEKGFADYCGVRYGVATLCCGSGQGITTIIENPNA